MWSPKDDSFHFIVSPSMAAPRGDGNAEARLLTLNGELLELVLAHGAQLRDTRLVYACRCACKRLKEATEPWRLFYTEERVVLCE